MRVLILTEGGSQIGLGHISRCSSLYDEIEGRGITVEFLIYGDISEYEIIRNRKYKVVNWLSEDFLTKYIKQNDYCIVDSYLANKGLFRDISKLAKKALYIDDNGRIIYPKGIIVNPSLSTEAVKYPKNDTNCYLLGPKYIILRNPFIQVKREYINSQVKEVLITLGGSDINNLTPGILKHLYRQNSDIIFNVVIGPAFKNMVELKSFNPKNIRFYENASAVEMKSIMLKSDLAITAVGQTIYELIATQTPFIPIKIIENQSNNVAGLKEFNLVKKVLDSKDIDLLQKIENEFNKLLCKNRRAEIVNMYNGVIDGLGSRRLIDILVDGKEVE
ncbi:hypothetical protein GCM10008967_06630 [Bacillus carboniphilus]|uniref:UDP-2,4-diacetamido-2,4, 6-trideoxy-beta-L-altropyranose hydrolase n=1 Tax=Bacillus carboniphilus TaxID=86663 RepID=A0ABN0VW51_9BACI